MTDRNSVGDSSESGEPQRIFIYFDGYRACSESELRSVPAWVCPPLAWSVTAGTSAEEASAAAAACREIRWAVRARQCTEWHHDMEAWKLKRMRSGGSRTRSGSSRTWLELPDPARKLPGVVCKLILKTAKRASEV